MAVTKFSGIGSFIGVPIADKKGTVYGTICGVDTAPFEFTETHAELLRHFSSILTYIVELENAEQQLQSNLEKAKKIQQSVLSQNYKSEVLEIDGLYYPSMYSSGDMYHWVQIDQNRFGILLIDVMGHGVSSALITMALRSLMSNLIKRVTKPVNVFKELNKHLNNLLPSQILSYATAIYLVIDLKKKKD